MLTDLTLLITPEMLREAAENPDKSLAGHLGTHFDAMDKVFPLAYTKRQAVVFDVSHVCGRDAEAEDIDLSKVEKDMFVAFHTGFSDEEAYGTRRYYKEHPQLSHALIGALLERGVSVIGTDCSGIRRGKEHTPTDQRCADRGVFVVENMRGLTKILEKEGAIFHTYPLNCTGLTGLPCRVVAETED